MIEMRISGKMSIISKQCSENTQIFVIMLTNDSQRPCSWHNTMFVQFSLELSHRTRIFFTFLISVSGQLQLHHINTFKSTGQKCSFRLGNQLYAKPDLKSPAGDSAEPGSCSDPSEQMWVESPVHWEIKQWMVLRAQCCSVFRLTNVHV